jgi:hypothetical protein
LALVDLFALEHPEAAELLAQEREKTQHLTLHARSLTWSEGRLSACAKDGVLLRAAANPRGMQGYAAGR